MNILEALDKVRSGRGGVLVARPPWSWGADAQLVELTTDFRVPQSVLDAGYQYVMGADDILPLLQFANRKKLSDEAVAEYVVHVASFDAEPEWIKYIPDA